MTDTPKPAPATPAATPLREANQQRVDAAVQRVRQAMDYSKYLRVDTFRKDVELLIEIALAPVLEIFAAAQPAATPMAARTFEEWWAESHRFATDADRMDHLIHVLSCPAMAAREAAEDAWNAATLAAAAQPQRESEQPEQVARLTDKILTELFKQYSGKELKSFRHALRRTLEPIMRAALAPQTDSQEPK